MDEFSRAVARVAAAQTAEVAGFESCHESAVDILGDVLLRYISSIAGGAHAYAELAGRTGPRPPAPPPLYSSLALRRGSSISPTAVRALRQLGW